MSRKIVLGAGLLLALLAVLGGAATYHAVGPNLPAIAPDSLEGAALAMIGSCGQASWVRDFRVAQKRQTTRGALVLFEGTCVSPLAGPEPRYGYVLRGQRVGSGRWEGGGGWGVNGTLDRNQVLDVSRGGTEIETDREAVAYGRVLSPQVHTIEATFGTGRSVRARPAGGMFAVFEAGTVDVCDVRALDARGRVLEGGAEPAPCAAAR